MRDLRRYVVVSVVYTPGKGWEAWDKRATPREIGQGETPHEALFDLIEKLSKLGLGAPEWVREKLP